MARKAKEPPEVTAVVRGAMSDVLESPGEMFRGQDEQSEYDLRWVYAPEGVGTTTKLIQRRAQGYIPVSVEETGIEGFGDSGDLIRAGDVILCKILKDRKQARRDQVEMLAAEEAARPEVAFRESIARQAHAAGGAVGATGVITERVVEHSLDLEGDS